jgi:hypothetical protein
MLDLLVELGAVTEAVASSGNSRLIGLAIASWLSKSAGARKGLRDLDLRSMGLLIGPGT